jgi:hypothetical protein
MGMRDAGICPVCGERYVKKLRGKKVTLPAGYDDCHKSVQLANGETVGRWYLHD